MIRSRYPKWLQHLMNNLVDLFQQYILASNVAKSCSMMCQPGAVRSRMSAYAKALKCTEVRDSYHMRLRRQIHCPDCRVELTAGYMTAHRCHMHVTEPAMDWNRLPVSQTKHHWQVYDVIFPQSTKCYPCPFPSCLGSSHTCNRLRLHFNIQQW